MVDSSTYKEVDFDLLPSFNAFVSSDFEDRRASLCTLQSEDNCLMSFSLLDSDHGNTIYNLKLYGKRVNIKITHYVARLIFWIVHMYVLNMSYRLSRGSKRSIDRSGRVHVCFHHRHCAPGHLEVSCFRPWPERGRQVRGGKGKSKMAVGMLPFRSFWQICRII